MNLSQGLRSALGRSQLPPAPWWFLCALLTCLTSFTAVPQGSLQMVQLKRLACTARPLRAATPLAALIRAKQSWGGAPSSSSHCAITRAHCAITSSQETSAGREAAGMP